MKMILEKSNGIANERLIIATTEEPCFASSWHYHPEYELLYISKSNGIRFVGDNVARFSQGDLVLIGPYLPHLWRNDSSYLSSSRQTKEVKIIDIKFRRDFIGQGTFDLPEFIEIKALLGLSKYGVCFGKSLSKDLHEEIVSLENLSPSRQSLKLLEILLRLSNAAEKYALSSTDMRQHPNENSQRIDTVLKFISENYNSYINLKDVAEIACLTPNSFCRFFKRMTTKSFTQFLNEVRIRNASQMLIQEDLPISDIGYLVGYRSITNFNRQFKEITTMTPKGYRQLHKGND